MWPAATLPLHRDRYVAATTRRKEGRKVVLVLSGSPSPPPLLLHPAGGLLLHTADLESHSQATSLLYSSTAGYRIVIFLRFGGWKCRVSLRLATIGRFSRDRWEIAMKTILRDRLVVVRRNGRHYPVIPDNSTRAFALCERNFPDSRVITIFYLCLPWSCAL